MSGLFKAMFEVKTKFFLITLTCKLSTVNIQRYHKLINVFPTGFIFCLETLSCYFPQLFINVSFAAENASYFLGGATIPVAPTKN